VWGSADPRQLANPPTLTRTAGDDCEIDGLCIYSTRRRRYGNYQSCTVTISGGAGPIYSQEFRTESGWDFLYVNNVAYSGYSAGFEGFRPFGEIRWYTDSCCTREGWRICLPSPSGSSGGGGGGGGGGGTTATMVTGVLSGAGDIASYLNTATLQEIAQFTCEAHYGTGNCLQGACGPLSYYYRNGGLSCNCGKAAGELEWVYSNDGAKHVSEDYSEDDGGVTPAVDIENHDLFVRRRTSADCTQSSWEIALKSLGLDKMPAYHLALDLRASDFTGGTSWASRVGGLSASVPAGMAFDPDEQAFVFDRTQVMTVDLATSKLSLPRVTYSAWVKVPRELPDDTKRDWAMGRASRAEALDH